MVNHRITIIPLYVLLKVSIKYVNIMILFVFITCYNQVTSMFLVRATTTYCVFVESYILQATKFFLYFIIY